MVLAALAVTAVVMAGVQGLVAILPAGCDDVACEAIESLVSARQESYQDAHDELIQEISDANKNPILPADSAPRVSCINHSRDGGSCSPVSLDIRNAQQRADGVMFLFRVEQDDAATEILDPAGVESLSTPSHVETEDEEIATPPLREPVNVSVRVQHPVTGNDETTVLGTGEGFDRGTGIREWTFGEDDLSTPRRAGTYMVTFIAESSQGTGESTPAIVTVIDVPPPQLQVAGPLPTLREGKATEYKLELAGDPTGQKVTWDLEVSSPRVTLSATRVTLDQHGAPAVITITAPDDEVALGNELITIHHTFQTDPQLTTWTDWVLDDFSTNLLLIDDDSAGISLSTPNGTLHLAEGSSGNASLHLTSQPQSDVTVSVGLGNVAGASVEPAELKFTPEDWDEPQNVTVRVSVDGEIGNIRQYALTAAVTTPTPPLEPNTDYRPGVQAFLPVIVVDEEAVLLRTLGGLTEVSIPPLQPGNQVRVQPVMRPEGPVTVTITSSAPDVLEPVPARLTFTPSNWTQTQAVYFKVVSGEAPPGPLGVMSFEVADESSMPYRGTKSLQVSVTGVEPAHSLDEEEPFAPPELNVPEGLSATRNGQQVTLTWQASPVDATPAYAVWRFPGSQLAGITPASAGQTQSFVELMPGPIHRYAVQAVTGVSQPQFNEALSTPWVIVATPGALEQTCQGQIDADRDGLCDYFESIIMTSPTNPDTDGDGVSDYDEYHAGTDPLNPDSIPLHESESRSTMGKPMMYGIGGAAAILVLSAAILTVMIMRRKAPKDP